MTEESEIDILKKHICCHSDEEVARILAEFRREAVKDEGERIAQALEQEAKRAEYGIAEGAFIEAADIARGVTR